jgi:hypothetical protein
MLQMKFDRTRVPEKNDAGVVEAGHGPAVQSQRPRSDDEVSARQRSVSHCRHLGHVWCRKVFLHDLGSVRQKLWQLVGEVQIVADDDRHGSLQNLRLIRFRSKPGGALPFHRGYAPRQTARGYCSQMSGPISGDHRFRVPDRPLQDDLPIRWGCERSERSDQATDRLKRKSQVGALSGNGCWSAQHRVMPSRFTRRT